MNRLEELKNDLEVCGDWIKKNYFKLPHEVQKIIARGVVRTEDYILYEEKRLNDGNRKIETEKF
jgi:hypothetical protein